MTEKTIQSIPVIPLALMLPCINAILGFIIGSFYALLFGSLLSTIPITTPNGINLTLLRVIFGADALIVMPILGFVGGFIQDLLYAVLYNFLAPRIGGTRLRFKEEKQLAQ